MLHKLGIERHFHAVEISSVTGLIKPDSAAFLHALDGRCPRSALYVDDKAANVRAARDVGISSLQADPAGDWIDEVERWLGSASDSAHLRSDVRRADPSDHRESLQRSR
ncbi:hypothetical protein GCM10023405_14260 [Streptomonospora salina]